MFQIDPNIFKNNSLLIDTSPNAQRAHFPSLPIIDRNKPTELKNYLDKKLPTASATRATQVGVLPKRTRK